MTSLFLDPSVIYVINAITVLTGTLQHSTAPIQNPSTAPIQPTMELRQARERATGEMSRPGISRKYKAKSIVENPRKELMVAEFPPEDN